MREVNHMPLDHFISQVHLRNFYSPELSGRQMYGFRKSDGHIFPCQSRDVCRVENGSTNEYLLHDRSIEEFLKGIEPQYNQAVAELKSGRPSRNAIYVVAGFVSYVTSCSPTAMRLGADPLRSSVKATAKILDRQGKIPRAPEELGQRSISDLIDSGEVLINIDEKYPQAIGITQILDRLGIWANCAWELIHNDHQSSPFFTSDFASAIERSDDPRILNRLVPLTPDFAIRIRPSFNAKKHRKDFEFPKFQCRTIRAEHQEVRSINEAIVRCAENFIFFRQRQNWVEPFLKKNKGYWIEPHTIEIPVERGFLNVSTMRIGLKS
jgi:hypothetical protein